MERTYTVVLMSEATGGYSVFVPALPGCYSQGETMAEAVAMARESIELFLAMLEDDGDPLPPDNPQVTLDMSSTSKAVVRHVKVMVTEGSRVA